MHALSEFGSPNTVFKHSISYDCLVWFVQSRIHSWCTLCIVHKNLSLSGDDSFDSLGYQSHWGNCEISQISLSTPRTVSRGLCLELLRLCDCCNSDSGLDLGSCCHNLREQRHVTFQHDFDLQRSVYIVGRFVFSFPLSLMMLRLCVSAFWIPSH